MPELLIDVLDNLYKTITSSTNKIFKSSVFFIIWYHVGSSSNNLNFEFKSHTPGSIFYFDYTRPSNDVLNKLYNENKKYLSE